MFWIYMVAKRVKTRLGCVLMKGRRIADKETLSKEALIWQKERNEKAIKVNWTFTTNNAREKLKNRYEEINKQS